ncbi:hypothetical protein TCT1_32170 [Xenorhabdus sp. TCT-1]|uniref:Uncharacterized protein n=1 Tax=Xenorhabdus taiwanensis TaxID=3085177 RepID=A0ABN7C7A5_9GAMM|nr:hypothetical protein TCT1_32170 [Xenorhabdus sp. TCT-1]
MEKGWSIGEGGGGVGGLAVMGYEVLYALVTPSMVVVVHTLLAITFYLYSPFRILSPAFWGG